MLIKFETSSYPTIKMFDYAGKKLIKLMGHSGAIPSAVHTKDIPELLYKLQQALKNVIDLEEDKNKAYDEEDSISLNKRAEPLIKMLEAAVKNEEDVMWDFV
jgi:hypothetical protein